MSDRHPTFKTIANGCDTIRQNADDAYAYWEAGDNDLALETLRQMAADALTLHSQIRQAADDFTGALASNATDDERETVAPGDEHYYEPKA